ncbi:hypothetical protein LWF01_09110 [Saxibacter everestensis]|uniref:Uncharacterized protein n=1 Tax=Saxibacter everestensis TaxID=2909229 RepID=A0ABY8QZJ9_9MICO|nr:hypothetical protein LWF01_09110 [Brevibacteriaceae bacterium ZFBP1038]
MEPNARIDGGRTVSAIIRQLSDLEARLETYAPSDDLRTSLNGAFKALEALKWTLEQESA